MALAIAVTASLGAAFLLYQLCITLFVGPLTRIPGPRLFAVTKWRLAYEDYKGTRTRTLLDLHKTYGPVVRVGPDEVSFNSTTALRKIYGAGSGFERTEFYRMFDVYGRKNLFTFGAVAEHAGRKKMLAHAYAKSTMLKGSGAVMIENKVRLYLDLISRDKQASEIFSSLHYFSLDTISEFVYGRFGKTSCLEGVQADRALLQDIVDTARRKLAWFAVHLPRFTAWLYSRTGLAGLIARQFYPMQMPTTYTGIRCHALDACKSFITIAMGANGEVEAGSTLIAKLWKHHQTRKGDSTLDDLDIASECADHLLAGIDTTSDALMFLIWAISRPENQVFQQKLIDEVRSIPAGGVNEDGIPRAEATDKLTYLNAVIKEALRLYASLPSSEPRYHPTATLIDGYIIPARTVVSISPYVLHRNPKVFQNPSQFNPARWLSASQDVSEMNRWFWAFSSGGRICIGMHLAMAEMTTLIAAIYRKYTTTVKGNPDTVSPGITSRFEVFSDEGCAKIREHECEIDFEVN